MLISHLKTIKIMRTKFIIFILVILFPVSFIHAQTAKLKIGYTNMDNILTQLPEYKEIETEITSYQKQLSNQLNSKYQEYQDKLSDYQNKMQQGNMAPEVRKDKEQELTDLQASIQKFQADADTSIQKKSAELLQPAYEKIQKTINAVAVENGFTHIFSSVVGAVPIVLYGVPEDDITELVLKKLGVQPAAKTSTTTNK